METKTKWRERERVFTTSIMLCPIQFAGNSEPPWFMSSLLDCFRSEGDLSLWVKSSGAIV